ncbi:hypothetical protein DV517_74440 [Streptomyces sp. S816]|uniref:hypothetical protein n=1 Tax=Streptomyces sp. S816 TaxID=2283197 RepID=UPI00109C7E9E|nr:hypothetical protein [Streptomyces sp. S816]TGZ12349.1 hypothetical protein DV517_74440 [Streptomyces sp. S816]
MAFKEKFRAAYQALKDASGPLPGESDTPTCPVPRISLYELDPPGVFYQDRDRPAEDDETPDKVLDYYRMIYGPRVPLAAARQLDELLVHSDLAVQLDIGKGRVPAVTRETLHSLHAHGMLLIAADGSLWSTEPPAFPGGQWTFEEKKAEPQRDR